MSFLQTSKSNKIKCHAFCIFSGFHNLLFVMFLQGPFFYKHVSFVELPPECDSSDDSTQCAEGEICSQGVCNDGLLIFLTGKN